eukprot:336931-Amphidinium_carterae.1
MIVQSCHKGRRVVRTNLWVFERAHTCSNKVWKSFIWDVSGEADDLCCDACTCGGSQTPDDAA